MSQLPAVVNVIARKVEPARATVMRPSGGYLDLAALRALIEQTEGWAQGSMVESVLDSKSRSLTGLRVIDSTSLPPTPARRIVHSLTELKAAVGTSQAILRNSANENLYSVYSRSLGERFQMRLISPSQPADPDVVFLSAPNGLEIIWQEEEKA